MAENDDEEKLLRSVALQNANSILLARQRAEQELIAAKEELRESSERVTDILESITDGFIAMDAEWRFTYLNPRGIEILRPLQESRENLLGQNHWTRFPDLVGTPLEQHYRRAMEDRVTVEFDFYYPALARWFEIRAYPAKDGLSIYFQDITERKRAESELKEAIAAAKKANLAKTDFISSMSHELRTPLNAILGFAQLVESGSPSPTPGQKRSIDQILKAGWYLLELINEILDLALIESGKLTLSEEPASLVEVMLECRAMIEPLAQQRGIGVTFPPFEILYFVKADRTRVKQILINLLFNAIKYNKPGGAVAVECSLRPPHSIRISVRDTGVGLSAEQLALLFQPFNRLGKEGGAEEGTGIGLVVTKRLVELMGGTIGVDSAVGVGSVFWIELSLMAAPQLLATRETGQGAPVQPRVPEGTPQRTLLCVEDNPANLEMVEQLVARRSDLHLLSAADGKLGIEFARAYLPEVILMDINLPGVSGIEAMKILRADPSTAHIPIIALSANALPRDIEKGLKAGFFSYITKPIKINEFMDALDTALNFSKTASGRAAKKEHA